jgi:hypothetical protein
MSSVDVGTSVYGTRKAAMKKETVNDRAATKKSKMGIKE